MASANYWRKRIDVNYQNEISEAFQIGAQNHFRSSFNLINREGPHSDGIFTYRLTIGDFSGIGQAKTVYEAKMQAALQILPACGVLLGKTAEYTLLNMDVDMHPFIYMVQLVAAEETVVAIGETHKAAKRNAASKMLNIFGYNYPVFEPTPKQRVVPQDVQPAAETEKVVDEVPTVPTEINTKTERKPAADTENVVVEVPTVQTETLTQIREEPAAKIENVVDEVTSIQTEILARTEAEPAAETENVVDEITTVPAEIITQTEKEPPAEEPKLLPEDRTSPQDSPASTAPQVDTTHLPADLLELLPPDVLPMLVAMGVVQSSNVQLCEPTPSETVEDLAKDVTTTSQEVQWTANLRVHILMRDNTTEPQNPHCEVTPDLARTCQESSVDSQHESPHKDEYNTDKIAKGDPLDSQKLVEEVLNEIEQTVQNINQNNMTEPQKPGFEVTPDSDRTYQESSVENLKMNKNSKDEVSEEEISESQKIVATVLDEIIQNLVNRSQDIETLAPQEPEQVENVPNTLMDTSSQNDQFHIEEEVQTLPDLEQTPPDVTEIQDNQNFETPLTSQQKNDEEEEEKEEEKEEKEEEKKVKEEEEEIKVNLQVLPPEVLSQLIFMGVITQNDGIVEWVQPKSTTTCQEEPEEVHSLLQSEKDPTIVVPAAVESADENATDQTVGEAESQEEVSPTSATIPPETNTSTTLPEEMSLILIRAFLKKIFKKAGLDDCYERSLCTVRLHAKIYKHLTVDGQWKVSTKNVEKIGKTAAKRLIEDYGSADALLKALQEAQDPALEAAVVEHLNTELRAFQTRPKSAVLWFFSRVRRAFTCC
ncbi:hypothetical protein WMY93_022823 [Mugilogobius chulae]|uniref:DRBM domain-containing protein n=1 Tax=Mugilogobius chulae TaxID=88201 RepID=A0AAW0N808_9GOBI